MSRIRAWLPALVAPAVVAGAVIGGSVIAPAYAATSGSGTPSASKVLALMADAKDAHYWGSVTQTSDLGLPQIPSSFAGELGASSGQIANIEDLLTASHTARVYVDGRQKQRVQLIENLAERDTIRNGKTVWMWDSATSTATHVILPAKKDTTGATPAPETATPPTPQSLADKVVAQVSKVSTLSVTSGNVAGRSAWVLTVTPKTSDTLVSRAVISVDQKTGVPLAAELDARGQSKPAESVRFTAVDFGVPAPSNFDFTPPASAKVKTETLPGIGQKPGGHTTGTKPTVIGSGWTSILSVPAGSGSTGLGSLSSSQAKALDQLTQQVSGGRGLQTSLFSVLLTNDGRVFAGAVPLSALQAAAK